MLRGGSLQVKNIVTVSRVKVTADGQAVVSHPRLGMVPELAGLPTLADPSQSRGGRWNRAAGTCSNPDDPYVHKVVVRCDAAGATHAFVDACRQARVGFCFGCTSRRQSPEPAVRFDRPVPPNRRYAKLRLSVRHASLPPSEGAK
jgi:hypothetical protein